MSTKRVSRHTRTGKESIIRAEREKERLKNLVKVKVRCFKCDSSKSYTNPMATCLTCKNKFCFDDITVTIGKNGTEDYCKKHL